MSKIVEKLSEIIFSYYPQVRKTFRDLVSLKDVPITMTQLTCLNILYKNGKMSMTDLAKQLTMSNQQLTKVMDALVEFNMAERITDPTNRRKIYAQATQKGEGTILALKKELDRKLGHYLNTFPQEEVDKLYDSVSHVASFFGHIEK